MLTCWVLLVLAAPPEKAASARLSRCAVSAIDEIDVAAKEAGQILAVEVREGAMVGIGALLASLDDEIPRHQRATAMLELRAAQAKAENDIGVRHARSAAEVAKTEFDDAEQVNKRSPGTLSQTEVRRRKLQYQTALLQIEQSEFEQQVNGITSLAKGAEVAAADAAIARRRVAAPIGGVVTELFKSAGEWVQAGDRLARITRLDALRVEGFLRAGEFDPDQLDHRPVVVEAVLANGQKERFPGKITYVNPKVEADGEFRVWAEVANRKPGKNWLLWPGVQVDMQIELAAEQGATAARNEP